MDKNGKAGKEITSLYPGDFVSLKEMRTMDDGKQWFVIRAKNEAGRDIELALDPKSLDYDIENPEKSKIWIAAPNARRIKKVGEDASTTTPEPGMDAAACAWADCKQLHNGADIEVKDAVLALTSEGRSDFKWRSYYKNKDGQWINSQETSRVDEIFSNMDYASDPNCKTNKPQDPTKDIPDSANGIAEVGSEQQLDTVLQHIGDCHEMGGNYHERVISTTAKKPLAVMYKEKKMPDGSTQIVHATRADWVAIDVLARTLYGEAADCFKKGLHYPESIAKVVLNRVDFKNGTELGKRFISSDGDESNLDHRNDITNAIFKDRQFSIWNRNEAARRMVMCPPSKADKPFWTGHLPGANEQKIWRNAVRIASQAVLQGETFRKRTGDLKALYYTNGFKLSEKSYTEMPYGFIGGKKIPISGCVQFWKEKDLAVTHPQWGIFHPFFGQALLPLAGN